MAEFYQIKIGSIWLTKDSLEQAAGIGMRCKLTVDGVDKLQSDYLKNRFNDFRGNPIIQKTQVGKAGREIVITIDGKLPVVTAEALIALHRDSELNDTAFRVIGNDTDTPDFDVFVLPDKDPFIWKGPDGFGNYTGAVLRYVTIGSTFLFDLGDRLMDLGDLLTDTP
jgi:hypothetical protein